MHSMARRLFLLVVLAILAVLAARGASAEPVVINEVHYRPLDRSEPVEFIELHNPGGAAADLSAWKLSSGVEFVFPPGTRLEAGGYLVVASSPERLLARFGVQAAGKFQGRLSREGETLTLLDSSGKTVDQVDCRLGFPWPTVGDPPGASIELVHPALDNSLGGSWRPCRPPRGRTGQGGPTPGARNSDFSTEHPPQLRAVEHDPLEPRSGQDVLITVKATDPEGVARVDLEYQVVEPGKYIEIGDAAYRTGWAPLALNDSGEAGDARAGDGVFTARVPAEVQRHRRLVRYRLTARDRAGSSVTVPYPEDPQPNFAYFVYDGLPPWRGAIEPRSPDPERARVVEYGPAVLGRVAVYHLLSRRESVENATWHERTSDDEYNWRGTLVHGGKVYDHIRYRARGGSWRHAMGKNMWKVDFNRGHDLEALDHYGRKHRRGWTKLNLGACIQQGNYGHRGEHGMFEAVGFRLFNLAGVESPHTHWAHLRIIDDAREYRDQYRGDFWGLYLAVEPMDGTFLDEHGLPDGNLYKMEAGSGELNHLGRTGVKDRSDLQEFLRGYSRRSPPDSWWRKHLDLPRYYSYRSIVEAIHHYDIDEGAGKNYFYLLDPRTGRWSVHPWDIDLTWSNRMYGNGESPFKRRVLERPAFRREYLDRLREVRDLLFNSEETGRLIDEYAAVIHDPRGGLSLAAADRALWDYHPVMSDPRRAMVGFKTSPGLFYRVSPTGDFAGMVRKMKQFEKSRAEWIDEQLLGDLPAPPAPQVARAEGERGPGPASLRFRVSLPAGKKAPAGIRFRLGEVAAPEGQSPGPRTPGKYEIEAVWESGELQRAPPEVEVPAGVVKPGKTYRFRARLKDASGAWSHWSAPAEFRAEG